MRQGSVALALAAATLFAAGLAACGTYHPIDLSDHPDAARPDAAPVDHRPASTDAGVDAADASDAGSPVGPGCNLGDHYVVIEPVSDPGPPPAQTGGFIVDGIYELSKIVQYRSTAPSTFAESSVLLFFQGTFSLVQHVEVLDAGIGEHAFGTYSVQDNVLTTTFTCPSPLVDTAEYTTDGKTLQSMKTNGSVVFTYTRK